MTDDRPEDEGLWPAFERIERLLGFFKALAVLLAVIATVVPLLVGYWIVGENARAIKRWESIQFESAVRRVPDADVQRLSRRIDRLYTQLEENDERVRKEMRELKASVDRLLGRLEEP